MDYESVMLSGIMSFFLLGVPAGLGVFIIDDLSKGLLGDPFIAAICVIVSLTVMGTSLIVSKGGV